MDIPLLTGYLLLLSWLTVILLTMMHSIKVLPRMSSLTVFLLTLAMAAYGFSAMPYFYVVLLLLTLAVSGFVGGLAYGYLPLGRNVSDDVHTILAIVSIAFTVLGLIGFAMLDLPIRALMIGGIILAGFSEGFREVMSTLLGKLSGLALVLMISASTLLIPSLIPSSDLILDGAGLIGVLVGLAIRHSMS